MSMSQEEIEALMNGLDLSDSVAESAPLVEEQKESLSTDDIEALMAETSTVSENEDDDLDDLIAQHASLMDEVKEDFGRFEIEEKPIATQEVAESALISSPDMLPNEDHEVIARSWTNKQIESGVFPLPVEKHNKVVNQLHQVAQDGEEQATRIFDVLSFILDENNGVQKNSKALDDFVIKQTLLLQNLVKKFPNIPVFQEHLALARSVANCASEINSRVGQENAQLFEAMELMQYHDINRQKIERVMSVIKKLSNYLNNLFEDETGTPDVKIAKHIHGDQHNEVVAESDLEALIAEFGRS